VFSSIEAKEYLSNIKKNEPYAYILNIEDKRIVD